MLFLSADPSRDCVALTSISSSRDFSYFNFPKEIVFSLIKLQIRNTTYSLEFFSDEEITFVLFYLHHGNTRNLYITNFFWRYIMYIFASNFCQASLSET